MKKKLEEQVMDALAKIGEPESQAVRVAGIMKRLGITSKEAIKSISDFSRAMDEFSKTIGIDKAK